MYSESNVEVCAGGDSFIVWGGAIGTASAGGLFILGASGFGREGVVRVEFVVGVDPSGAANFTFVSEGGQNSGL